MADEHTTLFERLANLIGKGTLDTVAEQLRDAARAGLAEQRSHFAGQVRRGRGPRPDPDLAPDEALARAAARVWDLATRLQDEHDPDQRRILEAQLDEARAAEAAERGRYERARADGWEPELDQDEEPGRQLQRLAVERASRARAVQEDRDSGAPPDALAASQAELDMARARQAVAERRYDEAVASGRRPDLGGATPERAVEAAIQELDHLSHRVPPPGSAADDVRAALDAQLRVARARLDEALGVLRGSAQAGEPAGPGTLAGSAPDDATEHAAMDRLVARRQRDKAQPGSDQETVRSAALELASVRHQAALVRLDGRLAYGWRPRERPGTDLDAEARKLERARSALASPSVQGDQDLRAYFDTVVTTAEARLRAGGRSIAPGEPQPLSVFDEQLAAARVAALRGELEVAGFAGDPALVGWLQARLEEAERVLAGAHEMTEIDVAEGAGVIARVLDRAELAEQDRERWAQTLTEALDSAAASHPAVRAWLEERLRQADAPTRPAGTGDGHDDRDGHPGDHDRTVVDEEHAQQVEPAASPAAEPASEPVEEQAETPEAGNDGGGVDHPAARLAQPGAAPFQAPPNLDPPTVTPGPDPGLCSRGVPVFCPHPPGKEGEQGKEGPEQPLDLVERTERFPPPEPLPPLVTDPPPPPDELILPGPTGRPLPPDTGCGIEGAEGLCPRPDEPLVQPQPARPDLGGWLSEPAWLEPVMTCLSLLC